MANVQESKTLYQKVKGLKLEYCLTHQIALNLGIMFLSELLLTLMDILTSEQNRDHSSISIQMWPFSMISGVIDCGNVWRNKLIAYKTKSTYLNLKLKQQHLNLD